MYTKVWFPRIRYAYVYQTNAYNKRILKFDFPELGMLITNVYQR